jgi:hypothetical protein
MPKPYPILAAALAASGHSLSTVTVAAPVEPRGVWPIRESDWVPGLGGMPVLNLESIFGMEPFQKRAPAKAAALSA